MANGTVIFAAVEGVVDEAVVRKLIEHGGGTPGDIFGKQGKLLLHQKIAAYNHAAQHAHWIVLVDLDREEDCAPPLRNSWLPNPAPNLCFRVAVREVEAWVLADAEELASFLGVSRKRVPAQPETLDDPKDTLVNLARMSRRRDIREDMVPRPGSGRAVGPAYASRMIEFVSGRWRPGIAAARADSLRRAIACIKRLASAT